MSPYTPVSLPTSSPPGSGSVVSETPIPVLNMMPLSGPPLRMMLSSEFPAPVLGTSSLSGPPVPVLCTMPSSGNPPGAVPDTSGTLTNSPFYEYVSTGAYLLL